MQDNPIHAVLNLPDKAIIRFLSLQMIMWGRNTHFSCEADATQFELHFIDCREMRWQLYTHMQDEANPAFPPTELANIKIGRNQHRSPAHLLTEHFGLSLIYGELHLVHNKQRYPLGD